MSLIAWPPPYQVKKNRLARRVKLRISHVKGLQITVPYRFSLKHLPDVLDEHRVWISEELQKLAQRLQQPAPLSIDLQAIHELWPIEYLKADVKTRLIERPAREIAILGKVDDVNSCKQLLREWIKRKAKVHLPHYVNVISERTGLFYKHLTIRDQTTRWGSCSSDQSINLNYKLILLPPNLFEHVIIHELCHTRYLNHSAKFWKLVASHDVNYDENKKALKKADGYLPAWL